ncbi:Zinc finger, CCHC-type [Sesbania bispinosa]|nr:Zinc finger, CCHC-type [Sesbania bispinosa]
MENALSADQGELPREEADLLARSTKKAKVADGELSNADGTIVMDTFDEGAGGILDNPCLLERDVSEEETTESNDEDSISKDSEDEAGSFMDDKSSSSGDDSSGDEEPYMGRLPKCLVVKVTKEERKHACQPWKNSIIVKLLRKWVGLKYFTFRLLKLWNPTGEIEAVWIRIPSLPIEYYDRTILSKIGDTLGRTVKVDSNTMKPKNGVWEETTTKRGKFACLCIEVDLKKPLISKFELLGRSYNVEHEGLYLICFSCGKYGHRSDGCPLTVKANTEAQTHQNVDGANENQKVRAVGNVVVDDPPAAVGGKEVNDKRAVNDAYGPWMLVQKPVRRKAASAVPNVKKNQKGDSLVGKNVVDKNLAAGSRFAIFEDDVAMGEGEYPHEQGSTEIKADNKLLVKEHVQVGPSNSQEKIYSNQGIISDPTKPSTQETSPRPTTDTNIRKAARGQANMGPVQILSIAQPNNSVIHQQDRIPVVQPVEIIQASYCPTNNMGDGGVCNMRQLDPRIVVQVNQNLIDVSQSDDDQVMEPAAQVDGVGSSPVN